MEENKNIEPEQPPENIPKEIIPSQENILQKAEDATTEESQTSILKTETSNMEVHHHTHPAHGKKTWKAYFWEFLMLFLAVFCGFLAEYQLEHVIFSGVCFGSIFLFSSIKLCQVIFFF